MGLFDDLKGMAMQELQTQGPTLLNQCLAKTPLGGCTGLLDQLVQNGLGPQVQSWLQPGAANLPVSADQLKGAIDNEHVQQMAQHMGVPTDQIFQMLAQHLPQMASEQANG